MNASMLLLILAVIRSLGTSALSIGTCPDCSMVDCDVRSSDCPFGVVEDRCKNKVCGQGLGRRCGGPYELHGRCAKGLQCTCNGVCVDCAADDCIEVIGFDCFLKLRGPNELGGKVGPNQYNDIPPRM